MENGPVTVEDGAPKSKRSAVIWILIVLIVIGIGYWWDQKRQSQSFDIDVATIAARTYTPTTTIDNVIDLDTDPETSLSSPVLPYTDGKVTANILQHRKDGQWKWDPNKVHLYFSDIQQRGESVDGRTLRAELADQPVLNANALEYLFAHQDLIPKEWQGKDIFFWGTIYQMPDGEEYIGYLASLDDGTWLRQYYRINESWGDTFAAAIFDK